MKARLTDEQIVRKLIAADRNQFVRSLTSMASVRPLIMSDASELATWVRSTLSVYLT
jgi:hypothetical protein